MNLVSRWLFVLVSLGSFQQTPALAAATAVALADHSGAAVSLFNNMRTPAALIGGAIIPLGIITAQPLEDTDTARAKFMKKTSLLLAVVSLLSEILAVTYSSIAINKLVEVKSPLTAGVAELLEQTHELAWLGTNVHFLLGLMGFGLSVGLKAFFIQGNPVGRIAIGWSVAAFLQELSVVNRGIAMGSETADGISSNFASNLLTLIVRYASLALKNSTGGVCSMGALLVGAISAYFTVKGLITSAKGEDD